jgi:hypothetical protein
MGRWSLSLSIRLKVARLVTTVLSTAAHGENRTRLAQFGLKGILSKQKFVERELCELIEQCIDTKTS